MADKELTTVIKKLAQQAVETYLKKDKIMKAKTDHPFLEQKAAAFVSLKINNQLRGCLGTIMPQQESLAREIIANAIRAATEDYRFSPVQLQELFQISYSVDVLSDLTPVVNIKELNPKKYGILVQQGTLQGLLLPDLEGVETVKQQLDIVKHKAGIHSDSGLQIYKFKVQRF